MKASVQLDVLDPTAVETGKPREQVLVEDSIVLNIQFNKLNVIENNDSLPLMVGTNDSEKDDWIIIIEKIKNKEIYIMKKWIKIKQRRIYINY